jgi:hypothetical protein
MKGEIIFCVDGFKLKIKNKELEMTIKSPKMIKNFLDIGILYNVTMRPLTKDLCKFLVEAKISTYASGDKSKLIKEKDKSTSVYYSAGDWLYHDNYFGGEPFGGREAVFFKNQPVYLMVYYGLVLDSGIPIKKIYGFLQQALKLIPEDKPFRGPAFLKEGDFEYKNFFEGEIENFSGEEVIYYQRKEVFKTEYLGGLVDQQKE